jgi:putative DNA primase/helicase
MEVGNPISAAELVEEFIQRFKLRDTSILDDKFPQTNEVIHVIESYYNKSDLAKQFINTMPLYYDDSGIWWRWLVNDKKWIIVDETDILNLVSKSSRENTINSKERAEILNALKQRARLNKPLMPKSTWIQFREEVVDIETGERFIANSKYFFVNPIPFRLGSNPDTPCMDKIFKEWVGEKYVKTLYQIIAYCLIPDYPIHRLFCFIGGGMNGKSCFLNLLRKFIGNDNVTSTELDTLMGSRFEVTRLHKKLVCQLGETDFNEMSKTSIIKKLTGGDLIGFEYKNKNPFEEYNYAKIIIATNNLPATTDKTLGFYRRWLIIDFPNQFSEQKDILSEIPLEEYESLGMKCIELLHDLLKTRQFHNEGSIEERMEKYEAKADFLQKFLDEFTQEKVGEYITKADFYKKFKDWCKENRHREIAENTLGKKMKNKGIEAGKKYASWLHDGKGGQIKIWVDLQWKL